MSAVGGESPLVSNIIRKDPLKWGRSPHLDNPTKEKIYIGEVGIRGWKIGGKRDMRVVRQRTSWGEGNSTQISM